MASTFKYRKIDTGRLEPEYEVIVRKTGEVIGTVRRSTQRDREHVLVYWYNSGPKPSWARRTYPSWTRQNAAAELFKNLFGEEAYRDLVREEAEVKYDAR